VNVPQFCRDLTAAGNEIQSSGGDPESPDFMSFEVSVTAAQAEAPAAVASDMTSLVQAVNQIDAADSAGQNPTADLNKWWGPVSDWAKTNCPAAVTTTTLAAVSNSDTLSNDGFSDDLGGGSSDCTTDDLGNCTTDGSASDDTSSNDTPPSSDGLCYSNNLPLPGDSNPSDTDLSSCTDG
jgi:hypothetical protein